MNSYENKYASYPDVYRMSTSLTFIASFLYVLTKTRRPCVTAGETLPHQSRLEPASFEVDV